MQQVIAKWVINESIKNVELWPMMDFQTKALDAECYFDF